MLISFFSGTLFTQDFLNDSVRQMDTYSALSDSEIDALDAKLRAQVEAFPAETRPNETQTENDLIWPVVNVLGWAETLPQQNLTRGSGRADVPDGLLFTDAASKTKANAIADEWKRYAHGAAIIESKRWARRLDRLSRTGSDVGTPSAQILRYLSRADVVTDRALKWGILTNGETWRLYWQDAKSRANDYLSLNLPDLLGNPNIELRRHGLRVFLLAFGRIGFIPTGTNGLTFHARALEESKRYEARVADSLSEKIFGKVFPSLARAVADASPEASLETVREETLVLLYRLLFILFAEDRDLLPVNDSRYEDYSLRAIRDEVRERLNIDDAFSSVASNYWSKFADLCRIIDKGEKRLGMPPYNGGLFNSEAHALLDNIRLPDSVMVEIIDAMAFERFDGERRYINYRDLSVQQLGSIYERLLEYGLVREGELVDIRPNIFARKGSGSYYTPDDLVGLILDETLGPLVERAHEQEDPAKAILDLKVCDPAMGSGHFLVSLVDWLADRIGDAIQGADGQSEVAERLERMRATINDNANDGNWIIKEEHLDDPHLIRRMVLKRCVYGVDKNPMAVELAKVALWLHTFTVGAPLSFLDHHLKCGDSLFGLWVRDWQREVQAEGGELLSQPLLREATSAENIMRTIERLSDADIDQVNESKSLYGEMTGKVSELDEVMSFATALRWMDLSKTDKALVHALYQEQYGEPRHIMAGLRPPRKREQGSERITEIWHEARELVEEERFLHWQVAFPGVWQNWQGAKLQGGFDAVIGNPPWDRIKLQQVEWFAERRPAIAALPRASDRKKAIAKLKSDGDPLHADFVKADERTKAMLKQARKTKRKRGKNHDVTNTGKLYPESYYWLGRGDVNLYSLFVERAATLVRPGGMVGLLVPSGIASDKTAAPFFRNIATTGRLRALYDFENKKVFFPDVHASFKFSVFIFGGDTDTDANCAFYLRSVDTITDPDRAFPLGPADFARINPNTGTAPIFRTRRDAELTRRIYDRVPVLVDRSDGEEAKAWPVKYTRMFDMTNNSDKFRTLDELKTQEKAWPAGGNIWESADGIWLPLYEGKMVQAFDHRAADIIVNLENVNRPAQPVPSSPDQKKDPNWLPDPQFWISGSSLRAESDADYHFSYKMITAPTNMRTMISAVLPKAGVGNSMGVMLNKSQQQFLEAYLCGNTNAAIFDFAIRQKIQGQNINWYIVEQLPVVLPDTYDTHRFGPKTAGVVVREAVLELTYTAHDMVPFARDMGYVDENGDVRPPFIWDEDRRLHLRAKLDAIYFILYGITDPDDVDYIYSTFPIVQRQEERDYGSYRSRDLAKHWINALEAGRPDAKIE